MLDKYRGVDAGVGQRDDRPLSELKLPRRPVQILPAQALPTQTLCAQTQNFPLTTSQAAHLLYVSTGTVTRLIDQGQLESYRLKTSLKETGHHRRILLGSVISIIEQGNIPRDRLTEFARDRALLLPAQPAPEN